MKKRFLVAGFYWAVALISTFADDFKLQVISDTLVIQSGTGEKVSEIFQGTVGKQVSVGTSQFLVSFGKDVRNHLSAIISPVIDKHSPLNFSTLNKSVKTDGNAIVTIHYSSDLTTAQIDPGFIGRAEVAELGGGTTPSAPVKSEVEPSATIPVAGQKAPTVVDSSSASVTEMASAPLGRSMEEAKEARKDIFTLLKSEGIKGLFDSKNIVSSKERKLRSQSAFAGSISAEGIKSSSEVESIGKMKSVSSEIISRSSQDKPGTVRLVLVQGTVSAGGTPVQEDAVVSKESIIQTGDKSSVVAIIGGIHVLTIHPNSQVTIAQSIKEKTMETIVDLKEGTVFADVSKRDGFSQNFKIKTINGAVSATGSQALVAWRGGKMVAIAFQSPWKGENSSGNQIFIVRPMVVPGENSLKTVSFSSIPAITGAELQNEVKQMIARIGENMTSDPSRNGNFISHPVASFVQGNALNLPNGSVNPGATLEGALRNAIIALTDNLESESKDNGNELLVGNARDPLVFTVFDNFDNGRNGQQPGETTPGGL
jgi:hypothetical protein